MSCTTCGNPTSKSYGVTPKHSQVSSQDGGLSGYSQGMNQRIGTSWSSFFAGIELKLGYEVGDWNTTSVIGMAALAAARNKTLRGLPYSVVTTTTVSGWPLPHSSKGMAG